MSACTAALAPASALGQPLRVGEGPDALPAVSEVPLAAAAPLGFAARLGLDYGLTESVLHDQDTHHRTQLDVAGSVTPLPWLAAAVRLLGRYDKHIGGPNDGDDGIITESHFTGRAATNIGRAWRAGTELSLWLPGATSIADSARAVSGDLQLLATYLPASSPLTLGMAAGVRIDRSKYSGGDPSAYSAADRLALSVSDSVLAGRLGLAVSYRIDRIDLLAEWSWKVYFDYAAQSPMWIRAGARYHASRFWQLEALVGVSPSPRPPLTAGTPLALVEPRFGLQLAAALAFPWEVRPTESSALESNAKPRRQPAPAPAPAPTARVRGQVQTAGPQPLAGASLMLDQAGTLHETVSDAEGAFAFDQLPVGQYRVRASAPGWIAQEQQVELTAGADLTLAIELEPELPKGQIRVTVRSFQGAPLTASIAISTLGVERPSREDGSFEIDVEPGEYDVTVRAKGYKRQTRRARVEENGVAILIMELRPDKP